MPRRYATRKRLHAIELLNSGAKPRAVARQLRVHLATVYRWRNAHLAEVRASAIASRPMVVTVQSTKVRGVKQPAIHIRAANDYTWGGASVDVLLPRVHEVLELHLQRRLSSDSRVGRALDRAKQQLEELGPPCQVPPRGPEVWSSWSKYLEILDGLWVAIDAVLEPLVTREVKTPKGTRRIRT